MQYHIIFAKATGVVMFKGSANACVAFIHNNGLVKNTYGVFPPIPN